MVCPMVPKMAARKACLKEHPIVVSGCQKGSMKDQDWASKSVAEMASEMALGTLMGTGKMKELQKPTVGSTLMEMNSEMNLEKEMGHQLECLMATRMVCCLVPKRAC